MVTRPIALKSLHAVVGILCALLPRMTTSIAKLTNADLLARLKHAGLESNRLLAERILLLIEVDERRMHLEEAHPSLFAFCLKELRMSEGEAYRRINAAKLVKRIPRLLRYIERGEIHLSALVQLRDYLTDENVDDLVAATTGRNKMEIAELVARLAPRPDVPAKLRKLPQHDVGSRVTQSKAPKPSLDPLSEARYRLQVTASRLLRDKLLRARDLMMHSNPTGDLAVVVERAIDELLDVLEKQVLGKLSRKPADASLQPMSKAQRASGASSASKPTTPSDSLTKTAAQRSPGLARTSSTATTASTANGERMKHALASGGGAPTRVEVVSLRRASRATRKT
jgi:hypothetical protein